MTTGIEVELTYSELRIAAETGIQRQCQTYVRNGVRVKYQHERENGWTYNIEGAAGEMAVARWLNIYWNGSLGNLKAPDVGNLQVRTRSQHWHELGLHEDENPEDRCILVTGQAPKLWLRGWIVARDGMQEKYWKTLAPNMRPGFFVPHSDLLPMLALKEAADNRRLRVVA